MEHVQLSDILVEPVKTSPSAVLGRTLGEVTKEQLMGVIDELPVLDTTGTSTRKLPPPITFSDDEE